MLLEFINISTQTLYMNKGIHWVATEYETKSQVVEKIGKTLESQKCNRAMQFRLLRHICSNSKDDRKVKRKRAKSLGEIFRVKRDLYLTEKREESSRGLSNRCLI